MTTTDSRRRDWRARYPIFAPLAGGLFGIAAASLAVAQVEAPSESDFFDIAQGTWCRLDLHDPATMELEIPDNADGMMTSVLSSPYATIETEARFIDFVVEGNLVIVTFQGRTDNKRAHDNSVFTVDFNRQFVFDMALTRFNVASVAGRQAWFSRCPDPVANDAAPAATNGSDDAMSNQTPDNGDPGPSDAANSKKPSNASSQTVPTDGRFEPLPAAVELPPLPAMDGLTPPGHRT